jgi:hypothetical protein
MKNTPVNVSDQIRDRKDAYAGQCADDCDGVAERDSNHRAVFGALAYPFVRPRMRMIHTKPESPRQCNDSPRDRRAPVTFPR